jgi:hypothetical protein
MTTATDNAALADTHARLLALEMVTSALLNRLAANDPEMRTILQDLAEPQALPDGAAAGGEEGLAHLQANVARLAGAITARL